MKIAVTSMGPTLEDQVEARFGRCRYFLIVDADSLEFEAVENPNIALGGGAGIQSAQLMADKGVSHVLTGNCGPNAFQVFGQAGVNVVVGVAGIARTAVERFKAGEFACADSANVGSHFGMATDGEPIGQPVDVGFDGIPPQSFGMGMGRGGGMGGGRGMGMGRGRGRGRGMGRGMGQGAGFSTWGFGGMHALGVDFHQRTSAPVDKPPARAPRQDNRAGTGAGAVRSGRKAVAFVRPDRCAGCGICLDVCPVGAIRIEQQHAVVDPARCTACAACVSECPNEAAIIIQHKF